MFKTSLIVIAIVILVPLAGLLVYAATKPDSFRMERQAVVNAPPEKIFALINDLQNWSAWSPWEKKDPDMQRTYTGPRMGEGAVYEWKGDRAIGHGRMKIIEAQAPARVVLTLDFFKPMEAHNIAEFHMEEKDGRTRVTWALHGPQTYMAKVMTSIVSMERMIGPDFEAGLENLKALSEK